MKRLFFELKILFIPCLENQHQPHFLKSRGLFLYIVVLVVFNIFAATSLVFLPKTIFFADISENILFALTNRERESMNLAPLEENLKLNEAASQKAKDMLANNYFAHYSPTGVTPWHWFKNVDYKYQAAGENLAIGFADSEELVKAWIDSPSHRANLLNSNFQEMGIAVLTGEFNGQETTIVVQSFGSPVPKNSPASDSGGIEEITTTTITATTTQPAVAAAAQFITVDYFGGIAQKILFVSLILIALALILNIFIQIKIQNKALILRSVFFLVLLALLIVLTRKEVILKLIPHNLQI